jgi:hypothetical protein
MPINPTLFAYALSSSLEFQIAIVTLFYWSKDIPNLIITMSMHFFPSRFVAIVY